MFTSDTLDIYKLPISMLPQPLKHSSGERRCCQEGTLSTTSEVPTLVDDTETICTMKPQPADDVPFISNGHEPDVNNILSMVSDESTLVENSRIIKILLKNQPFILYNDPSDTQDIVLVRSTQFRRFLEQEE